MAYYAALVSVVQLLEDVVHHDRYPNLPITRQAVLKSLQQKFNLLEDSLQDFTSKGDEATDRVEGRIRDVAYQAQDIIESEISGQLLSEKRDQSNPVGRFYPQERNHVKKSIFHRLYYACQTAFNRQERSEIQEGDEKYVEDLHMVQQELDLVVEEVMLIKDKQRIEGLKPNHDSVDVGAPEQAPTSSTVMVGFDVYLTTIKDQLCGQSSRLRVIPIVGMGGIGKTTLARSIFDDALISYYFDYRVWVTVSPNYDENRVLQSIVKSMDLSMNNEALEGEDLMELMVDNESLEGEEAALKEKIYKSLKGRRYLIVVDDVWTTKVWDDVKQIFPDDRNGSRIMLTTRLLDVAHFTGNYGSIHEMPFLTEEQSWNLLQERVFAQKHCPPELEHTGKFIASKCHGLPLAIVVIAGILSNAKTPNNWKKIATDVRDILSRTDEDFSSIISLSYNHLSHQLKACFLYMGSFPEGYEIDVSKLINLWIAEGFLKSSNESKSLERVAEECLEDLVKRNLVLITRKRSNGHFKSCILHDLLMDFCRQRAFHEYFSHVMDKEGYLYPRGIEMEMVRRINLDTCLLYQQNSKNIAKLVRSILVFGDVHEESSGNVEWDSYGKLLRVLDIAEMVSSSTPTSIYQMFHLKYLGLYLRNAHLRNYLPSSISVLHNLQTLVIHSDTTFNPVILPPQIWKMTQLRHVIIRSLILPSIPTASDDGPVHKLGCLQTLMTVLNFRFTEEAIEIIPNLRKLKIECWGNELRHTWESYCIYNLVLLSMLEELKINFYGIDSLQSQNLPPNFAFTVNLRKLTLQGCMLPWKDLSVVGLLPSLQVLRLREQSFLGEEWKPTEGEFESLKFLVLESLDIKYWRAENSQFPCLEHLKVCYCFALEIPLEIGDIPSLKFIHVSGSQPAEDSAILIRDEQQSLGNEMLQVRVDRW